jgi:hypothetical protein
MGSSLTDFVSSVSSYPMLALGVTLPPRFRRVRVVFSVRAASKRSASPGWEHTQGVDSLPQLRTVPTTTAKLPAPAGLATYIRMSRPTTGPRPRGAGSQVDTW